jgi:hypothetical protein
MLVKYSPWRNGEDQWGVKIEEGKFADTTISINSIALGKDETSLEVDFNFLTITPETDPEKTHKQDFDAVLQPIIEDIIRAAVKLMEDHETRDPNTQ